MTRRGGDRRGEESEGGGRRGNELRRTGARMWREGRKWARRRRGTGEGKEMTDMGEAERRQQEPGGDANKGEG